VGGLIGHPWCHVASTPSDDDLHTFAERLGLTRRSFDRDHYGLTLARRAMVIELGAVGVTANEMMYVIRYDRRGLPGPNR
jgi:hypothetical protein